MKVRAQTIKKGDLVLHLGHWEPITKIRVDVKLDTEGRWDTTVQLWSVGTEQDDYLLVACKGNKEFEVIRDFN